MNVFDSVEPDQIEKHTPGPLITQPCAAGLIVLLIAFQEATASVCRFGAYTG